MFSHTYIWCTYACVYCKGMYVRVCIYSCIHIITLAYVKQDTYTHQTATHLSTPLTLKFVHFLAHNNPNSCCLPYLKNSLLQRITSHAFWYTYIHTYNINTYSIYLHIYMYICGFFSLLFSIFLVNRLSFNSFSVL